MSLTTSPAVLIEGARVFDGTGEPARVQDVLVEGVTADESPFAYKDIERVMQLQESAGLLTRVARMRPIAVHMAGEDGVD